VIKLLKYCSRCRAECLYIILNSVFYSPKKDNLYVPYSFDFVAEVLVKKWMHLKLIAQIILWVVGFIKDLTKVQIDPTNSAPSLLLG